MEITIKEKKEMDSLFGTSPERELKLSYSRCSDYSRNGAKCLIKRSTVDNEGAKIGSITDDLLYSKMVDKKHFNKLYYKYNGAKPTATLLRLCNVITVNELKIPKVKRILEIVKKNNWWSSTIDETKLIAKFNTKQFWDYIKAFFLGTGKTIMSTEEFLLGEDLVNILLTHEYSQHVFFDKKCENLYQYKIKFKFKGFIFRGMLDILQINSKDKTVKMIDLKTGKEPASEFLKSFLRWRYDFQEAVYTASFESICKDLKLEGYTLLPFEFLYISRNERIPFIYEITPLWHKAARRGFKTSNNWNYKGLDEIIEEIKWHWDNKVFDKTRRLHEANGKATLDDSFITLKVK